MMIVDASAIVAILLGEPEEAAFRAALSTSHNAMSAINFWEVLVRAYGFGGSAGQEQAEALIHVYEIEIVSIDAQQTRAAAEAFARFGRKTVAGLNLGDCFAYALAKSHGGGALLYKGDDFPRTDIRSASPIA